MSDHANTSLAAKGTSLTARNTGNIKKRCQGPQKLAFCHEYEYGSNLGAPVNFWLILFLYKQPF